MSTTSASVIVSDETNGRDNLPATVPEVQKLEALIGELSLPAEQRGRLKKEVRATMRVLHHRGPLPPPEQYAAYGEVVPDAPERILRMAEKQQDHDHALDNRVLASEIWYRILGLIASFLIIGLLIGGAIYCASRGMEGAAVALGGSAGLSALAGLFIRGRNLIKIQNKQDLRPSPPPSTKKR